MQNDYKSLSGENNNSCAKRKLIIFTVCLSVVVGLSLYALFIIVPEQYRFNIMEYGPICLAFCIFCFYLVVRQRVITLKKNLIIRFAISMLVLFIVVGIEPWQIATVLLKNASSFFSGFIALWFQQFIILIVMAGGMCAVLCVSIKLRPINLRLFSVRLLLIVATTAAAVTIFRTGLFLLSSDMMSLDVDYIFYSLGSFFRVLVSGFAFYFVTVSFFKDTKSFGANGKIDNSGTKSAMKEAEEQDQQQVFRIPSLTWMLLVIIALMALLYLLKIVGYPSYDLTAQKLPMLLFCGSLIVWSLRDVYRRIGIKLTLVATVLSGFIYFLVGTLLVPFLISGLLYEFIAEPYATIILSICNIAVFFACFVFAVSFLKNRASIRIGRKLVNVKVLALIVSSMFILALAAYEGIHDLNVYNIYSENSPMLLLSLFDEPFPLYQYYELFLKWLFAVACVWKFETSADDD